MIEACSADANLARIAADLGFDPCPKVVLKSSFVCEDPSSAILIIKPLPPMDPEVLRMLEDWDRMAAWLRGSFLVPARVCK